MRSIQQTQIERAKSVPIVSFLQSRNVLPAHSLTGKNQYCYLSPIQDEKTPSFFVNEVANVFNCFASGQRGDIIRLVMLIENVPFTDAVAYLLTFHCPTDPITIRGYELPDAIQAKQIVGIKGIYRLNSPKLIEYVERVRRIPFRIAVNHVKQVHYQRGGKAYYGVGMRTDIGSWAIRASGFQTWIGPSDITTIKGETDRLNVFEGFFDYLSAMAHFGANKLRNQTIILNSTSNLSRAMGAIESTKLVNSFLDHDKAGDKATARIQAANPHTIDQRYIYAGHNDFNDFVAQRQR